MGLSENRGTYFGALIIRILLLIVSPKKLETGLRTNSAGFLIHFS